MTREQWRGVTQRTRQNKVSGTLRSQWGRQWCTELGVVPTEEEMMKALDDGIMSWQAAVIECIDYDEGLLTQLTRLQ